MGKLAKTISWALAVGLTALASSARADDAASPVAAVLVGPPQSRHSYIQFGVALSAEAVVSPGPICSDPNNPCILGSGGGIVIRAGWRPNEYLYVGGAYEVSKQDPNQLYRLGILQQARVEARRYFPGGRDTVPFLLLGAGLAGYGNEWGIDTWGPSATLGVGLEMQLGGPVLGLALAYRPIYLQSWVDSSTLPHDAGVAHFAGLEMALEVQDVL